MARIIKLKIRSSSPISSIEPSSAHQAPPPGRDDGRPSAVMYLSPLAMRELIRDLKRNPWKFFWRQ